MFDIIEVALICLIGIICIYVYSIYARPYSILEGKRNRLAIGKKKKKNKPPPPGATVKDAPESDETDDPENENTIPPGGNASPGGGGKSITGIGATAKIFYQSIMARIGSLDVQLDTNSFESDYLQIIDQMKELMYRKALKSCLEYTNDAAENSIHKMNAYISTIANLDKLTEYVNGNSPTQQSSGRASGNSQDGWFG